MQNNPLLSSATSIDLLSRDYLSFMGVAHEPSDEADSDAGAPIDVKSLLRKRFLSNLRGLVGRLTAAIEENADAACDQMGKRLMSEVGLLAKYHPELSCHDDTVVSLIIVRECTRHSSPDDAKNSFYTHHNEKNSSNYQQALPPALEVSERARTVVGVGERWHAVKKTVVNRVEIDPDTHVR